MKQCCSIHFWGEELLVAVIDIYLNWLGIISPGVPNLFGCFTLKVLEGPESSEPGPMYVAPKIKYFQWFQRIGSYEIIPNSNAYQMGMTSPSLQLSSCGASDLPERHGSRLRQCSREKSAVQDSAGREKVPN